MSTPATSIYLCSGVPLNNKYDHTLYFSDAAAQLEYFESKVDRTLIDYSYVRKSWNLKVAATMEDARKWSYLFFRNGTGKRYFYFINQCEYINDNAVELTLEMDVMQTYMFEWTLRPCFVEREHSVYDYFGMNTVDEGLDTGELRIEAVQGADLGDQCIIIASTIDLLDFLYHDRETAVKGLYYDNIFTGLSLIAIRYNNSRLFLGPTLLTKLETHGKMDTIFTMWQYPEKLIDIYAYNTASEQYGGYVNKGKYYDVKVEHNLTTIDGYRPRNKKLFQYPYSVLYVSNNQGGASVYRYEYFSEVAPTDTWQSIYFRVKGNISPDAVVKITPKDYKDMEFNYDESFSMGNFPLCTWNSDTYKMWLAQNQNQQNFATDMNKLKIAGGVAAIAGGIAGTVLTGGAGAGVGVGAITAGVGMIASGASNIASQLAQNADRDIQPPQAHGNYSGSYNVSQGLQTFLFYQKTVDAQHAKMIDDYFTMYGYATKKVKVPNISSRPAFNYVKTINSNIGGNFCMEDLQKINGIFDKGITFWKSDDIGNYSLGNSAY